MIIYLVILLLIILIIIYILYNRRQKTKLKRDVITGLKTIDEIFNKHNIWYISAFGTLLGGVRHWDMIPWDDDGDIIVLRKDVKRILELKDEFKSKGMEMETNWKLINIYPNKKKYPFIDIFIYDDIDGKFLRCMKPFEIECKYPSKKAKWWWEWVGFPTKWVKNRYRIKFANIELWAPGNSKELLEYWYGKDFLNICKTPNYDHIIGQYITPENIDCGQLPNPQL